MERIVRSPYLEEKMKDPYPWEGYNIIVDVKEFDSASKLHKGTYKMLSSSFDVMICKKKGLTLESYNHLRNFRHANAVPHLDYHLQAEKFGRLITPKVYSSFQSWFEKDGRSALFDKMGHMTSTFENLIIEYCDLVESLLKLELTIENFDLNDVYVNIFDGGPTLCVLLSEVKKVPCVGIVDSNKTWDCPRKFISWCEEQCGITRDSLTEKFCAFLGKSNCTLAKLKRYPHNWGDSVKGDYLMSLVGSDHSQMRLSLRGSGLKWPFRESLPPRPDSLPKLLQDILNWNQSERHKEHNVSDFFSYIILLRSCYKHLEGLPDNIKIILTNRKALIDHIEIWTPDFWTNVYEIIGWP